MREKLLEWNGKFEGIEEKNLPSMINISITEFILSAFATF